jgi:hypothetical protein
VFGSTKQLVDCPLGIDEDSHCPDCVNFSRPQITIPTTKPDIMEDVRIQQPPTSSNNLLPLVSRSGLELKENICVNG